MRIDMHVHTNRYSACSIIEPHELIEQARRIGLDGLCLTEHDTLWPPDEIEDLGRDSDVRIFRASEITTDHGHILIFGCTENLGDVSTLDGLRSEVMRAGGLTFAAHPFRGSLRYGLGELQMSVENACKRPVFHGVDGIEIANGMAWDSENNMARRVAERLGLIGIAGSDAHWIDELGHHVTIFERDIETEQQMVGELQAGRFTTSSSR